MLTLKSTPCTLACLITRSSRPVTFIFQDHDALPRFQQSWWTEKIESKPQSIKASRISYKHKLVSELHLITGQVNTTVEMVGPSTNFSSVSWNLSKTLYCQNIKFTELQSWTAIYSKENKTSRNRHSLRLNFKKL